jgi:CDP-paratose 2-epimerase
MSKTILITGGAGLVGFECCKLFAERGWEVISVDNYMRGKLFGAEGDTKQTMMMLLKGYNIEHYELDIRDEKIIPLIRRVNAVIHAAAQPSHPKSIEIPMEDFQINAYGTLFLLEALRKYNKDAVFIFCSTNKVYGDAPNYFSYRKVGKRFEPVDPSLWNGFDETLRIDRCMHTPFGVSKVAADLYTQEYARLYGLKTGVFRMGCITGGVAKAVEMHNWEPYFVKKALTGEKLTIYGYEGYQVRDVIHAKDLARLFYEFINNPRPGEVYNVGGGRKNSISLLEAIDLIEKITGKRIKYDFGPAREGDHIWWITNISKARLHYPNWDIRISLDEIFKEIYEFLIEHGLDKK